MSVEIIHGEAIDVLPRFRGEAALAYVDPCFGTGQSFSTREGELAFEDRFESLRAFRSYLSGLLEATRDTLALHGSLVVHCDASFVHEVRSALDALFGRARFCDQVVWRYRRWPAKGRRCQRVHDYLVRYVIDPARARWNQLYEPPAPSTLRQWGTKKQQAVVRDGVRRKSVRTDEESPGVPIGDVWEIPILAPQAKERTGFPTQKPERLLDRAVQLWSLAGDLVIDPTLGSGTTGAVAARHRRRFVGIDRSEVAIRYARERLAQTLTEAA